jgi:hypothetical protein
MRLAGASVPCCTSGFVENPGRSWSQFETMISSDASMSQLN